MAWWTSVSKTRKKQSLQTGWRVFGLRRMARFGAALGQSWHGAITWREAVPSGVCRGRLDLDALDGSLCLVARSETPRSASTRAKSFSISAELRGAINPRSCLAARHRRGERSRRGTDAPRVGAARAGPISHGGPGSSFRGQSVLPLCDCSPASALCPASRMPSLSPASRVLRTDGRRSAHDDRHTVAHWHSSTPPSQSVRFTAPRCSQTSVGSSRFVIVLPPAAFAVALAVGLALHYRKIVKNQVSPLLVSNRLKKR